jgi:hypothetical protein
MISDSGSDSSSVQYIDVGLSGIQSDESEGLHSPHENGKWSAWSRRAGSECRRRMIIGMCVCRSSFHPM